MAVCLFKGGGELRLIPDDVTSGFVSNSTWTCPGKNVCLLLFADDELDRMRQQMAETASLLASASYEQPQSQLQHYQVKLTEHLADPTQPLNLDMEGPDGEGQAAEAEPSPLAGRAQFSGLTDTPPRTPSQDAAGKAARAKRVASSREVCLLWRAVLCCAVLAFMINVNISININIDIDIDINTSTNTNTNIHMQWFAVQAGFVCFETVLGWFSCKRVMSARV